MIDKLPYLMLDYLFLHGPIMEILKPHLLILRNRNLFFPR